MARTTLQIRITLAMLAVALVTGGAAAFGPYLYYTLLDWLYPNLWGDDAWTFGDYLVFAAPIVLGLAIAVALGWRVAKGIARPVEEVAEAARAIAAGDFHARAGHERRGSGETESLVADFNSMADRLEQAEAELRYSNSAIAHELRTPLTILRGRLQGLADGVFQADSQLYGRLTQHVEDLSRLVEDLRTLGLFSAGQIELRLEVIDLAEEAAKVVEMMEPDLAVAGVEVHAHFVPAYVRGDGARLRQALLALLDNARRYAGAGILTVGTRVETAQVVLYCTDFGPGLPKGAESRVFDRFWRGDESRSRASGGSGLGLAVVRAVARAHQGDALAYSRPGAGTTVEIRLPLADQAAVEAQAAQVGRG
ncbi:MAG: hypothetical protein BGO82_11200 [Devosia sp. 67-54]|uniref:sensor histidine kinase n=1 Tax=unclassified Devosia TaxID=196773 RepID=UPI00095972A1|nr:MULTISPECIES: HAMP domain-containing sensor histidine kinase [unclassified Devosia]MBN9304794.1 HAMP domain-containing histidine kinase [Devosia sp.]OJX15246.1 MAG: hypothetical protein BGO82_11200 [Devosia sp. 67-54]